jgi:hypothetical protein
MGAIPSIAVLIIILSDLIAKVGCSGESNMTELYFKCRDEGLLTEQEIILEQGLKSACGRLPTMAERHKYYKYIRTGEMNTNDLIATMSASCGRSTNFSVPRWENRFKNKIYAWCVDLHASPPYCNQPIYRDIGVILHAEVDHRPNCEFVGGICKDRMKVFGLGAFMVGFSLDPDHNALKKSFYEHYQNESEFNRVDVFICSHPAANCELFEKFNKPMILYFTTRLEFGRDDMAVGWRVRAVSKWNAWGEIKSRQREWIEFIHRHHKKGLLTMVANSIYDVEYVEYFTGIRPRYIPSWCGDGDTSYGGKREWIGCTVSDSLVEYLSGYSKQSVSNATSFPDEQHQEHHGPLRKAVIFPYKSTSGLKGGEIDETSDFFRDLGFARKWFRGNYSKEPFEIAHSATVVKDHRPFMYRRFAALILIPYQTSVMTFFELYRFNIPIFAPSLEFVVNLHQRFGILGYVFI